MAPPGSRACSAVAARSTLILTGRDVGADEALAIGWLDARGAVDRRSRDMSPRVARRIAAMPPASVAAVKQVVDVSLAGGLHDGLVAESAALAAAHGRAEATADPMTRFLAAGGQTRDGETAAHGRDRRRPARRVKLLDSDFGQANDNHRRQSCRATQVSAIGITPIGDVVRDGRKCEDGR